MSDTPTITAFIAQFANEKKIYIANMHQQHVRQSDQLGLLNIRLRVPVQEHELRLRRPRLLHSTLRSVQATR